MSVPKRKQSKSRTRKRKAQWKMSDNFNLSTCSQSGNTHLRHHAYKVDGVLYYKGKILVKNN